VVDLVMLNAINCVSLCHSAVGTFNACPWLNCCQQWHCTVTVQALG